MVRPIQSAEHSLSVSQGRTCDWIIILQAGVASGTVLLFVALGEILAERSGVLNLGIEGMMLIGAMTAYSTAVATGQPWLGAFYAMLAAGARACFTRW